MKSGESKKNILAFMYAERLKAALIMAGELLHGLSKLQEGEREGGVKIFSSFIKGLNSEVRLAANAMGASDWHGLSGQVNLVEGYVVLGQMESAQQELSKTLSSITTLSGRAMTYLKDADLL